MGRVSARRSHSCELVAAIRADKHLPTIAESGHLYSVWVSTASCCFDLLLDIVAGYDDQKQTSSSVERSSSGVEGLTDSREEFVAVRHESP